MSYRNKELRLKRGWSKSRWMFICAGVLMMALAACGSTQGLNDATGEDPFPQTGASDAQTPQEAAEDGQTTASGETSDSEQGEGQVQEPDSAQDTEIPVQVENEAFRVRTPGSEESLGMSFEVRGEAHGSHTAGVVHYEVEDGHFVLAAGEAELEKGGEEWLPMRFTVDLDTPPSQMNGTLILFSGTAGDGSYRDALYVPLKFDEDIVEYLAEGNRG